MDNLCAVVLAGGKGKRMKSKKTNKVAMEIAGKPMVLRTLEILKDSGINNIVVVVGFAKDSVLNLLGKDIAIAEQKRRLGTGHALKQALPKVPKGIKYILVLYGDDSYLYSPDTFKQLYAKYIKDDLDIIFLSTLREDPFALGRIERGVSGKVFNIVEEKEASDNQKKIKEVNLGGFLFKLDFVKKNINKLSKNNVTGEYYLTDLVKLAVALGLNVDTLKLDNVRWQGVNTPKDLEDAQGMIKN